MTADRAAEERLVEAARQALDRELIFHMRWSPNTCRCGIVTRGDDAHRAHVAAMLLAGPVSAALVEARREALEFAAAEVESVGHHWSGASALAFFALAGDLRDRAAGVNS